MALSEIQLVTGPSVELELATIKQYMRIAYNEDDSLITMLIQQAREQCEHWCNRKFITQTWNAWYDKIDKRFALPCCPIQDVLSFNLVYLQESIPLTLNSDYYLMGNFDKFVILTATTYNLPPGFSLADDLWRFNLSIQFTCGYGDSYSDVPMGIQIAIMKTVAANYDMRANVQGTARTGISGFIELPNDAKSLLKPYKLVTI
jgi:uncharacterized phiE125 gp8 family phage protein